MGEEVPDEDPAELIREVMALEARIQEGLEELLREIETWTKRGRKPPDRRVEQQGKARAQYGEALLKKLAADVSARFGRGFGEVNLGQMKEFYLL